jgi:hypothetical protein
MSFLKNVSRKIFNSSEIKQKKRSDEEPLIDPHEKNQANEEITSDIGTMHKNHKFKQNIKRNDSKNNLLAGKRSV